MNECEVCKTNPGIYLIEKDGEVSAACATCLDLESYLANREAAKTLWIPPGKGEHRCLSEATRDDLDRSVAYLRELANRDFAEAAELEQFKRKRISQL